MGAKKLNEEDEDDGYWDEGEAPWRESASKYDEYDESNPFSLPNLLWLNKHGGVTKLNDGEHHVLKTLKSLLYNWDGEPEYSDVFQEELQKACGDYPSSLKRTLNSLSKKGLIDVQNVPTGEYKQTKWQFTRDKDGNLIPITKPLIYPKPLMVLYAINMGWGNPEWLQYALDDSKKQTIFHTETFNARYGGSNCGKCGGSHSGYCPDYGKEEYEYTKCTDCKWGSSTDSEYGPKNRVIEWCSSCKEKNEREAKINAERLRLQKEREEEEAQRRIDDEKSYWEWRDYQEDRYGAESFGADAASFDGGYRCSTCDKQYLYHNDRMHGGCSKYDEGCRCMGEAEARATYCCMEAESFAGEMDATEGYIENGVFQHIGNQGLVSQELYDLENGKYDEGDAWTCGGMIQKVGTNLPYNGWMGCPHIFKVGDYYAIEEDIGEYFCATCSKDWRTCEECDEVYDPDGEHMQSCDTCDGDGYVMVGYDPGDGYMEPPSSDSDPCGECYDGKVCGKDYLEAESDELEESKKSLYQQAIDTIEARVADYTTHEDVNPYWGGGMANPNKYLYHKLRYSWLNHPEDRGEIIEQYMRAIEDGRIDPSKPLPHGEPNQHLRSKWDAESFSAESNGDLQLDESKKRTKMSMIRTGLAITTFGIVLFNLWTNKKQEKDISDIMDLV